MSQQPAITLQHVTATYADAPALWNITADIPQHVLGAIVGPNGAGKTTLIKIMLGLMSPVSGSVRILGHDARRVRHTVAYVPQRRTVDWDFPVTVIDVVMMGCYHRVGWIRNPSQCEYDRAHNIIQHVGLEAYTHYPINRLSGGQRQRVFLARALLQDADIYMLDEPFVGVDKKSEATIIQILKELRNSGKTLLVVHHDLYTVRSYFDWVMLLNVELVAAGALDQAYTSENISRAYETAVDIITPSGASS